MIECGVNLRTLPRFGDCQLVLPGVQWLACVYPCQRFAHGVTTTGALTRSPRWNRYFLSCAVLSPAVPCRFIPALSLTPLFATASKPPRYETRAASCPWHPRKSLSRRRPHNYVHGRSFSRTAVAHRLGFCPVCHCLEQAVQRPARDRERRCLSHRHNKAPAVLRKSVAPLGRRSSPVCESGPSRHCLFQVLARPRLSGRQGAPARKPNGNSMRAITPAGLSGWCTSLGGETDVPPHRGRPRPARPAGEGVFFMQELHRPRTFRTRDRLRRPCAKNKEVWPNVSLTRLLHRSDEPTGVGRGPGRHPSRNQDFRSSRTSRRGAV